jgi:hypothetical protein
VLKLSAAQSPFLTIMLCTLSLISARRLGSLAADARSLGSGTAMPRCRGGHMHLQCYQQCCGCILALCKCSG